jgi:nucleoside-diphosphate-sugar epimerase
MSDGTILVTGASGFVGGHLAASLAASGHVLRLLSRTAPAAPLGGPGEWFQGNISDKERVRQAMRGVDTVFHAAALAPGRGSDRDVWETNVDGTRNIVEASLAAGVKRLVFLSSVAAYKPPLQPVVSEDAPLGGADMYGRSKCAAEELVCRECAGRLAYVILRPCQVYGPHDRTGFTSRLLRLLRLPVLPVAAASEGDFSLVHVDDLIAALLAAGDRTGLREGVFNIASASRTSLRQLAEVRRVLKRTRQLVFKVPAAWFGLGLSLRSLAKAVLTRNQDLAWRSYNPGFTHGNVLVGGPSYDIARATLALGYQPRVSYEASLGVLLDGNALQPK